MKKLDLGQTINTLANLGVIAGIIFLAIEIRASTRATQAASIQAASALDQEHLLLLGNDSETARIWFTYLQTPEDLTEDQQLQGHYMMAALIRRLENVLILNEMGALSPDGWDSRQDLLISMARTPGYSAFLEGPISPNMDQEFLGYMNSLRSTSP